MEEQGWRQAPDDAEVYFGGQKKQVALENRRPVIRNAADLVGPGIGAEAVRITDFNDLLATYNGYFSAVAGTFGAPNTTEAFVGVTVNDASLGGFQLFTGLTSTHTYKRTFTRNPADPTSILWNSWKDTSATVEVGTVYMWITSSAPPDHLMLDGSTFSGTAYPQLAAMLGGTTLPDLRDRTVFGTGASWGLFDTDGLTLLDRTKFLKHKHGYETDEGGLHYHNIVGIGNHSHGLWTQDAELITNVTQGGGAVQRAGPDTAHHHNINGDGGHDHGGMTGQTGLHKHTGFTRETHQIDYPVQRGVGLNYIVRAR